MERTTNPVAISWFPQSAPASTDAPVVVPVPAAAPTLTVTPKRKRGRPRIESRDQLLGQTVRMSILTALAETGSLSFMRLREIVRTNDGNLSIHARKLERAGYIKVEKKFAGRVPRTEYILTEVGQQALDEYGATS